MMEIPRRTIEDLKIRHELEPSLNDLYVEGDFDKEIISRTNCKRVIYSIDTVDVPAAAIISHGLTEGNKQRVIVLARELAEISDSSHNCLVDRDLDHWFGHLEATKRLIWSKYTSIELYFLNESFIKEILLTTAKCKIENWEKFYSSFIIALKSIYALRLADKSLDLNLSWVQFDKSLNSNKGLITFEVTSYIKKLPSKNPHLKKTDALIKKTDEWYSALDGDPKLCIRGHDLIFLIAWAINENKGIKNFNSEEAISRLFILLSDHASEIVNCIS